VHDGRIAKCIETLSRVPINPHGSDDDTQDITVRFIGVGVDYFVCICRHYYGTDSPYVGDSHWMFYLRGDNWPVDRIEDKKFFEGCVPDFAYEIDGDCSSDGLLMEPKSNWIPRICSSQRKSNLGKLDLDWWMLDYDCECYLATHTFLEFSAHDPKGFGYYMSQGGVNDLVRKLKAPEVLAIPNQIYDKIRKAKSLFDK